MSQYMLISSRDPFTCPSTGDYYALARELRQKGHEVTLFLVQNGVLAARATAQCESLRSVVAQGVTVLADDFSLRQRAIPSEVLLAGVAPAGLERVIDGMAAQAKTLWH